MFVKAVIWEQKLPFEVKVDPFYSRENMERLEKSIQQTQDKKTLKRINNDALEIAQCGSHYREK